MLNETRDRAANSLMETRTCFGGRFPKVFVCREHIFYTFKAAFRQLEEELAITGKIYDIEVLAFEDAFELVRGRTYGSGASDKRMHPIDRRINQVGLGSISASIYQTVYPNDNYNILSKNKK